jgi:hypothetical protein
LGRLRTVCILTNICIKLPLDYGPNFLILRLMGLYKPDA